MREKVDHPKHYNMGSIEVLTVIKDWKLDFNEGNVIKYFARAKHKGKFIEDMKKAMWYTQDLINDYHQSGTINQPKHTGTIDVDTIIEDWNLDHVEGDVIKCIIRAKYDGMYIEYLTTIITNIQQLMISKTNKK